MNVDDYTGLTAAAAVEAARAAGLRPAPERVEVVDAESHGLVVAHDPKAGATSTRGTILTLYVGAPAAHARPERDERGDQREDLAAAATEWARKREHARDYGSEAEFGLDAEAANDPATEEVTVESPLAHTAPNGAPPRTGATEDPPSRRSSTQRSLKRLATATAVMAAILVTAIVASHAAHERSLPVSRAKPVIEAQQPRQRERERRRKPNRARKRPRRRAPVAPAVLPPRPLAPHPAPIVEIAPRAAWPTRAPAPLAPDRDEFF